jgi:hypothetical protein
MRLGLALLVCAGCSFRTNPAAPTDAALDAPLLSDAVVGSAARQQAEFVAGAGRVTAGAITIDVEVGHAVLPRKSTAGTITITGAQVVSP